MRDQSAGDGIGRLGIDLPVLHVEERRGHAIEAGLDTGHEIGQQAGGIERAQNAGFGTGWAKSEMASNQPTGSLTFRNLLARGNIQDGVPHELREPIKRVLAKAFDIAVPPVLGELGFVEPWADAIGLHALCTQLS